MKIAVQMDSIESLNIEADSTLASSQRHLLPAKIGMV